MIVLQDLEGVDGLEGTVYACDSLRESSKGGSRSEEQTWCRVASSWTAWLELQLREREEEFTCID
jgi:hypothetical protein